MGLQAEAILYYGIPLGTEEALSTPGRRRSNRST